MNLDEYLRDLDRQESVNTKVCMDARRQFGLDPLTGLEIDCEDCPLDPSNRGGCPLAPKEEDQV